MGGWAEAAAVLLDMLGGPAAAQLAQATWIEGAAAVYQQPALPVSRGAGMIALYNT